VSTAPFSAKEFSLEAQKFLYACAFWTVAADESLKPAEQEWLIEQFGPDGATESLDAFVAMESDAFFKAFDDAAGAVSDAERRRLYPQLAEWLRSCAESDGGEATDEKATIEKVVRRVRLDSEMARLGLGAGRVATTPPPAPSAKDAEAREGEGVVMRGHASEITCLDVSPDGSRVVSGSDDGTVRLWSFSAGEELFCWTEHEMGAGAVRFTPDGQRVVTGDRMGTLRLWDGVSGRLLWKRATGNRGGVTSADWLPGGQTVVAWETGLLSGHEAQTGSEVWRIGDPTRGAIRAVGGGLGRTGLVTGGDDKSLRIWDAAAGRELREMSGHTDGVTCLSVSADGKRIVSGSRDNTVRVWVSDAGTCLATLRGHSFSVMGVCFSPDGKRIASASWDHTVRVWDAVSGTAQIKIESTSARFSAVRFLAAGQGLLVAGSDRVVRVISLEDSGAA
jgi:WD40 repeat protein